MSDQYVESAKQQMGAVERLLKGLPGISGYVDKELRRDADKRVRDGIVLALQQSQTSLMDVQNALLKGGGLALMDDVDGASVKLQTLTDRIKTASYGYAGLFDAQRIKEDQLDALYRFDVALAQQVGAIDDAIAALGQAVDERGNIAGATANLTKTVSAMARLFDRRQEAIMTPDLLSQPDYAPPPDLPAATPDIANDPNAVG